MAKKITFLHLSDLHLTSSDAHEQKIVLEALFVDIKKHTFSGKKFDAIFFTGDLVAKGEYNANTARYVNENFLIPLLEATGLPSTRLYIAPGNHDVETKVADTFSEPSYGALTTYKLVNQFFDNLHNRPHLLETLNSFNKCLETYGLDVPVSTNPLSRTYLFTVGDVSIAVACLNSAWRASGKSQDYDYGKLLMSERQVEAAIISGKDAQIKIALVHHPLNWITTFEQPAVQRSIFKNYDALFHGHNHHADASTLSSSIGNLFVSNAGCLYQSRDYFNGYSIVEATLDAGLSNWDVTAQEFYSDRQVFDISVRYAPLGKKTYPVYAHSVLNSLFPTPEYVNTIHEKINGQILSFAASEVAPKTLQAIFVEPPLAHLSERKFRAETNGDTPPTYLTLNALALNENVLFFVGRKEAGKTTILNYLCLQVNNSGYLAKQTHSFYINLETIGKITRASILDAAVQFAGGEYRKGEIIQLLNEGRGIVCFDNLDLKNDALIKLVTQFISEFGDCKFCFTIDESFEKSFNDSFLPNFPKPTEVVYLHSFSRKQARALVQNWFPDSPEKVRTKLDEILFSIRKLNIPQTPFLISILLWIQERNIQFSPVNHAEIIDTFIDGLLGKLSESKSRSKNDSKVKRHFLTELSFHLYGLKRKLITVAELEKFTINYFEEKALPSSALPFLEELFEKGILFRVNNDMFFKFDCFRAFFLASKIADSEDLKNYAISKRGFLELPIELDYYTGLFRDKIDILTAANLRLDEAIFGISAIKELSFPLDLMVFNKIGLPESVLSDEMKSLLQTKIFGNRPTIQEQELMFDRLDSPQLVEANHEGADEIVDPLTAQTESAATTEDWLPTFEEFMKILHLSSMLLRNSELVSDPELKRKMYQKIIFSWSQLLLLILLVIEDKDADNIEIEKSAAEGIPSLTKYVAKITVPNLIFMAILESLGTNKLETIIKSHVKDDDNTISRLLSIFLLADLGLPNYIEELRGLLNNESTTRYTYELIFYKSFSLYMLKNLPENEVKKIELLMADVFLAINNHTTKRKNDVIKAKFIDYLHKKSAVNKIINYSKEDGNNG